ncbi:MAG: hypothetical protein HOQ22_10220, partial [Nocardioidaceae bacterium]|nr:hypothetical protein [Nocardioidaceae bacterium]
MSTVLQPQAPVRRSARDRRAEKRRLRRMDALSGRLAELYAIRALLQDAAVIVSAGWVQGAWFTVADAGRTRTVTAYDLSVAETRPVIGACLVGAVVQSAGGPREVGTQLVQRSLDLLWHSMREDPRRPVRWCPGPRVRMMHVLELTYWNDAPQRTADEVSAL